jgi:glycosyltransferase involved in cell wall biosynthesis
LNRILIVTDAWSPQVNGVVRTLQTVRAELEKEGCTVEVISPDLFRSVRCPTYSEIRLALTTRRAVGARIEAFAPDALHIATEGPLGVAARAWALKRGFRFTTAYHTQFPDYVAQRTKLPASLFWRYIRWFHRPSHAIMVSTPTMAAQLAAQCLPHTAHWGRGVDLTLFRPDAAPHPAFEELARPIQLYVGRVAVEKNIEAFLESAHPGSKVMVGDGPALEGLKRRFPETRFLGALRGPPLASAYASADVFVFPSRTDTFGLVMIEALACGTPVAAYPVPGPLDVLTDEVGAMDEDLARATAAALTRDPIRCAAFAQGFTWAASARQFRDALIAMTASERSSARSEMVAGRQHEAQSELAEQQG